MEQHLGELGYSCKEDLTCNNDLICNKYKKCVRDNANCIPECEDWQECINKTCKTQKDKCLNDNDCNSEQSCKSHNCINNNCTPKTCSELNADCGSIDDGCGTQINCGNCENNQSCSNNQCVNNTPTESPNQLIKDRHFRRGFNVRSASYPGDIIGSLIPGFDTEAPIWSLGQWASFTDLNNFPKTIAPNGDVYWEDIYKKVTN